MAIDTKPNLSNKKFEQCSDDIMNLSGCTQIYGFLDIENDATLTICGGAGTGKVLTSDATGIATWQTSASGAGSGENITKEISQSSHGFGVQDFVGFSGGTYNKAIADGSYDGEFIGLVSCVSDVNTFCVTQAGYVSGLTGLVTDTTYFLSHSTAGLLTSTPPSTEGSIIKAVLLAETTTTGWVLPYVGYIYSTGTTGGDFNAVANGITDNGGTIELGGSLSKNTDIDVNTHNLSISGLAGKTTETNAIFVGADGTLVTGSTSSGCGVYISNSPATKTVGGITSGTVLTGQTLEYLLQEILAPYIEPAFSAFNAVITPQPFEVGVIQSGNKSFTWSTSTSGNVAANSIGICRVGGSLLGSGLANDGSEVLNIGTLSNSSPTTYTWQITGCSTQDNGFSRNVSKCSIYPYFWGVESGASRPTVSDSLVTGGTKVVANSCGTVTVNFGSNDEWTWLAIPATNPSTVPNKICWYQSELSKDTMLCAGSRYPDKQSATVSSPNDYWTGVAYCVYVSAYKSTDELAVQFRDS